MLLKKKVLHPTYYTQFACTGNQCEDNCCKEWSIIIDKPTYLKYKQVKDPDFKSKLPQRMKRIRGENATQRNYAQFILDENKVCKFQTEDKLCEIHAKLGHKNLCLTCQIYPRLASTVMDGLLEFSMTMSCPESAKAALLSPEPMAFQISEMELDTDSGILKGGVRQIAKNEDNQAYLPYAWAIRECCIDVLQHRQTALADRIFIIGLMLRKIVELKDQGKVEEIPGALSLYVAATKDGQYNNVLESFSHTSEMQAALESILVQTIILHSVEDKSAYKPFKQFVAEVMTIFGDKIELKPGELEPYLQIHEYVEERAAKHWDGFMQQYGHVLENYFVNYVFAHIFPFTHSDENLSLYHHFIILAEQYAIFRMVLSTNADPEQGITQQQLLHTIKGLSQVNQHSPVPKRIVETYRNTECDSLAHISFLLR